MIIAFTGKKGSGKSTASEFLNFTKINFKDSLVEEVQQNFPKLIKELQTLYGIKDIFVEKPTLARLLLQEYGTDVRRGDNPEYWTTKWLNKAENEENVVTDDVRFVNEAQAVRALGGKIYRIVREGGEKDTHISETEMDTIDVDGTIYNNGSITDLKKQITKLYAKT